MRTTKKLLFAMLAVAWMIGLLALSPLPVEAATADDLTFYINHNYSHGGTGTLSASQSGNTVTVTGIVANATNSLSLTIDSDVTVIWKAVFTGSANGLINLAGSGNGRFEIAKGGVISSSGPITLYGPPSSAFFIRVDGGSVENTGKDGEAIRANGANAKITVNDGQVTATGSNGTAISLAGSDSSLLVSGGKVGVSSSSVLGHAIFIGGAKSIVSVTGGRVSAYRDAIYVAGGNATVNVSGGEVLSEGPLIGSGIYMTDAISETTVKVTGGKVYAKGDGQNHAICSDGTGSRLEISGGSLTARGTLGTVLLRGSNATVSVSGKASLENTGSGDAIGGNDLTVSVKGGSVSAQAGGGIKANTVTVTGGKVSASGNKYAIAALSTEVTGGRVEALGTGNAIETQSAVVKGGTVSAKSGFAFDMATAASFKASGGFVFAYGTSHDIIGNVVKMDYGTPAMSDQAVLCVWDSPGGKPVFTEGTSTNLFANTGASASWGQKEGQPGIHYKKGSHQGFFVISGVTITEAAETTTPTTTPTTTSTKTSTATSTRTTPMTSPPPTSTSSLESPLTSEESLTTAETIIETAPSEDPVMTGEETLPDPDIIDGEKTKSFNWLWLLPIALAIIIIAVELAFIIMRRKKK